MNSRLASLLTATMVASITFVSPSLAQMRFAGGRGPAMRPGPGASFRPGLRGFGHFRRRGRFFGSPFNGNPDVLYPDYYDDGDYSDYAGQPPPPPPPYPPQELGDQAAAQPAPPSSPADPLVIEYQGEEWVRVTNTGGSPASAQPVQPVPAEHVASAGRHAIARRDQPATSAPELPPAVLVFRDGHQEEVKGYTIMGATLYTSADYWTTGSWTRQIRIAQLDVPATLKLNQQRGVKFSLPSGPNEVVMRP
ncbi:MAG TPA: hypothetical protein VG204_07390 [Terriglobia bacterium]|nr:hypothetical protein [Terriglobia bacterium]